MNQNDGELKVVSTSTTKIGYKPRQYIRVKDEKRMAFLKDVIHHKLSVLKAAKKHEIKISTAKVIMKNFREKGAIGKQQLEEKNEEQKVECDYKSYCQQLQQQLDQLRTLNLQLQSQITYYYSYPQQQLFFRY